MSSDATLAMQKEIIANQKKILANQQRIQRNHAKLDKIVTNQRKLDQILANQKAFLAGFVSGRAPAPPHDAGGRAASSRGSQPAETEAGRSRARSATGAGRRSPALPSPR